MKREIPAAMLFMSFVLSAASAAFEPIEVSAALQLDQVTDVNQKAGHFSVVGNFLMNWKEEGYAFDPAECEEKLFNTSQFEDWTRKNRLTWPRFLFYNQQGNRWIQEDVFIVRPDGEVGYVERFTLTFQAPDFNFVQYPFDRQKFGVHVVSLHRASAT